MTGTEIIYLVALVGTAAIGGYSAYQQGQQARDTAKFQEAVTNNNRKALQYQSDAEANRIRAKYRMIRGAQNAAYAKNGVTVDGSVSDIFADTNMQEDLDLMATLYKGKQAMVGEQARGNLLRAQGKNAYDQGILNAAGSVMSSAASGVGNYPSIE